MITNLVGRNIWSLFYFSYYKVKTTDKTFIKNKNIITKCCAELVVTKCHRLV